MSHLVARRERANRRQGRRHSFKRNLLAETLEDRRLLTVSSFFESGTLQITADAADDIAITQDFGQVKINGSDPDSGVLYAEEVAAIDIAAIGDFPNRIDLSNMDPYAFGGVSEIAMKGGGGDDVLIAPAITSMLFGEAGNDLLQCGPANHNLDGGGGDDEFIVDLTAGTPAVPSGIHVSGGEGGNDLLTMLGGGTGELEYTPSATTFGSGEVSGFVDSFFLSFEGLEPVNLQSFGNITIALPNADDLLTLASALFGGTEYLVVNGTSGGVAVEELRVSQAASLTIDTTANNSDGNDRIDINGGTSAHGIADVEIITGTGSDIIYVNGTQTLSGTLTVSSQGDVTGSSSANLDANVHVVGATVDPRGGGAGILEVGPMKFDANSTFKVEVHGTTPGTDHDQLRVNGTLDLGGATLNVTGSIGGASSANPIVLIDNDGTDAVTGTFAGLPGGSTVIVNGQNFEIQYNGGTGNDVVLMAIVTSAPMDVYVDDDLHATANGTPIADANPDAPGNQSGTFGIDVFATITEGVAAVAANGTVHIVGGTYAEDVHLAKPLTLDGTSPNRRDASIGGAGISIEAGGDGVILRDLHIVSELQAHSVAAPTLENVFSSGDVGFFGRNLTGVLRVENSLFQANQFTPFDIDSGGLHIVIENSAFQANTLGPISINNVDSLELRNVTFRGNTVGVMLSSIGTLTYDTQRSDISDEITFDSNALTHRSSGVDRDPLELLSIQNLVINTFGGEDHVTGRTHFAMTATIDTGNNLTGDSVTIEGSAISDSFTTSINGGDTEVRNGTQAPVILRGMESLTLKGSAGADRFDIAPSRDYAIMVDGGEPIGQNGEPTSFDVLNIVVQAQQFAYLNGPENDAGSIVVDDYLPISFDQVELAALQALPAPDGLPTFKSFPLPFGNPKSNPVDVASSGDGEVKVSQGNFQLTFLELESEEQVILDLSDSSEDVHFNFDGERFAQNFFVRGRGDNAVILNGGDGFGETTLNLQDDGTVQLTINPTITLSGVNGLFVNSTVKAINLDGSGLNDLFVIEDAFNGNTSVTLSLAQSLFSFKTVLPTAAEKLTINGGGGDDRVRLNSVGSAFKAALAVDGEAGTDVIHVPNMVAIPNDVSLVADVIDVTGGINTTGGGGLADIRLNGNTVNIHSLTVSAADVRLNASGNIQIDGPILTGGGPVVVRAGLDVRFGPAGSIDAQVVGGASLVDIEAGIFSGVSQKLNRPQVANSSVVWPTISPDGKWVIYLGDEDADQEQEMYRVPIAGGIATQISELPDFGVYESFAISPDSQRIVYTADREVDQRIELYSMSIMGGAVAKLSAMPAAGDIRSFAISPDGQSVVFEADRDTDDTYELYSVSIAGGTVTKLSSVQMVGDVYDFSISPDSRRVIYLADKDVDNQFDLYSVPITGGASIKLSALSAGGDLDISSLGIRKSFAISPDSLRVVYVADQDTDETFELFSVSIIGGAVVKLSSLPTDGDVFEFSISPDSQRVVYVADQELDDVFHLYSVPLAGGIPRKLAALPAHANVRSFTISLDSKEVVYAADQQVDAKFELFRVPIQGGDTTKLVALPAHANIELYYPRMSISPDGKYIVFAADRDVDGMLELYSVPLRGGAIVKLNAVLQPLGGVGSYSISPDSQHVIYLADKDIDDRFELFATTLPGQIRMASEAKINARGGNVRLATNGDILVSSIVTTADVSITTSHGAIIDYRTGEQPNIEANSVALRANSGIGHNNDLDLSVTTVAFQNSDSGDVNLTNSSSLTIGGVGALSASRNLNGHVRLDALGSISIEHNLGANSLMVSSIENPNSSQDNVVVRAGVAITATSMVRLNAGDDVVIEDRAAIQGDEITLSSGEHNQDLLGGITIEGSIDATGGATGSVTLLPEAGVKETSTGRILAPELILRGAGGFDLRDGTNDAGHLSGILRGDVIYADVDGVGIGGLQAFGSDLTVIADQIAIDGILELRSGSLALNATVNGVSQNSGAAIYADRLFVQGQGFFNLNAQDNHINIIGGSVDSISLTDRDGVTVGSVSAPALNSTFGGLFATNGIAVFAPQVRLSTILDSTTGLVSVNAIRSDGSDGTFEIIGTATEINAGSVQITNARLSADQLGRSLSIDTSSVTAGGDIVLPEFDATRPLLNRLFIDASGGSSDGIIHFVNGAFLANSGASNSADLTIRGDVELLQSIVFDTSSAFGFGGAIDLRETNVYARNVGASLTIDARAKGAIIGSLGTGGAIQLGRFSASGGRLEIENLNVFTTGGLGDGTIVVNHDVLVDGNITFAGVIELPRTTTLSTSTSVGDAGDIYLSDTRIRQFPHALPNLNIEATYVGSSTRNNSGGNVTLGALSGLDEVAINTTSTSGPGGNVLAVDKVQVEKLYIAGSRGSTLDASTVKFIDSLSVGVGGLNIHGFDEVNLSTVSSVGDVELSSFQSTRLINGIYTQGGDIVIEGSLLPTGAGGSVRHPVVLDTRLDNIGDAGSVRLHGGEVYGFWPGEHLRIVTSTAGVGGSVVLDSEFTNAPHLVSVGGLTVDTSGSTDGVISLGKDVKLGDNLGTSPGANWASPYLSLTGEVQLTDDILLDLSDTNAPGGIVDLSLASFSSNGTPQRNLSIDARHTGNSTFGSGGQVRLGEFLDPSAHAAVGRLTIDVSTSSTTRAGGQVSSGGTIQLADGLSIIAHGGLLTAPSQVLLNDDMLVSGTGGVDVRADVVKLKSGQSILSAGTVVITANQKLDLDGFVNATFNGAVGRDVRLSSNRIELSNDIVTKGGSVGQFVAGDILLNGNVVIDGPSVLLSTDAGGLGGAGAVRFTSGTISADQAGRKLTINTKSANVNANGGDVQLTPVTNTAGGAFLQSLVVDTSGMGTGMRGVITPDDIALRGDVLGNPSSLTLSGDVRLAKAVSFTTTDATNSGGNIDLRNAEFSATLPIVGLRIDSRYTGADARDGGSVSLGEFSDRGGHYVTELRVDSHSSGSGNHGVTDFTKQAILSGSLSANGPVVVNAAAPAVVLAYNQQDYRGSVTIGAANAHLVAGDIRFFDTVNLQRNALKVTVSGANSEARSAIGGTGDFIKSGVGALTLLNASSQIGHTTIEDGLLNIGTVVAPAELISNVAIAGGTLGGDGTLRGSVIMSATGGAVSPGSSPGLLEIDNDLVFNAAGSFEVELDGSGDRLRVSGSHRIVDLANAALNVSFTTKPAVGRKFTLIDNVDVQTSVIGMFSSLPNRAAVTNGSFRGRIDYFGGDGNDVVLEVLPYVPVASVSVDSSTITLGSVSDLAGTTSSGSGHFTLHAGDDGRIRISQPGSFFNVGGTLHQSESIEIPLLGGETFNLVAGAGATQLLLDLSGNEYGLRFDADTLSGMIEGVNFHISGFQGLQVIGDGNDNVSFAWPTNANSPIHVSGSADGGDWVSRSGDWDRAGNWGIVTSGLSSLTIESTGGSGEVIFDATSLNGANDYTANLQDTDVARIEGSNALGDNFVISRYGNAWHPVGAELKQGGANVRIAGAGRLEVRLGGGDDTLTIDVDQTRGSDVISIPILFDGGEGGLDTLELVGNPATTVESTTYRPGPDTHNGRLEFADAAQQRLMQVEFSGLEPIRNSVSSSFHNVYGSGLTENIVYDTVYQVPALFASSKLFGRVSIDDKESYSFQLENVSVAPTLLLYGEGGRDRFDVELPYRQAIDALRAISVIGGVDALGDRREQTELILRGSRNDENFEFEAASGSLPYTRLYVSQAGSSSRVKIETSAIADILLPESGGADSLTITGSDSAERLHFEPSLGSSEFALPFPAYRYDVSYFEADPAFPLGGNTLTAYAVKTLSADLGNGFDAVVVKGTDLNDDIRLTATSAVVRLGDSVALGNHESIRVESLGGDDRIEMLSPILIDVLIDAGVGDDDQLTVMGPASSATFTPFEEPRSGRLVTQRHGDRQTVDYSGVETLAAFLDQWDTAVYVGADNGDNDITVSHPGNPFINIDDRTEIQLYELGSDASIRVSGLKGADRFATTLADWDIYLDSGGSDADDVVTFYGNDVHYRPDALFSNGRAELSLIDFDEIIVEVESLLAASDESIPSFQYRTAGSDDPQAKAVAFVVPSDDVPIPLVRILGADRETTLSEAEFPSDSNGGVAFLASDRPAQDNLYFEVASSDGQAVPAFDLFAAVIEPGEFVDIPSGGQIAVQIDHNHRVAGRGTVPFGGNDLISVQIDHNHRIAAVVNNDPANRGSRAHSVLEILDATGEHVLASGSNIAGAIGNGVVTHPLPAGMYLVRIANNNSDGEGNYELVLFDVNDDNAVTSDSGAFPINASLEPGEHGRGSIPATPGIDDVASLTPLGNGRSTLQFNQSTPLSLRNVTSVELDARGGDDLLRMQGSANSDSVFLTANDLLMNNQSFLHQNFESFELQTGAGDDAVGVLQSLEVAGYLKFDGGDGIDRLAMQLDGPSAQLMLPAVIQDSRLVTSVAVERFSLHGSVDEIGNGTNIVVTGIADATGSVTVAPQTVDRVDISSGSFNADLTTTGRVTISSATPLLGSTLPIRQVEVVGTVFDDTIHVTESKVNFDGVLKTVGLLNIPSVAVDGAAGQDRFFVIPSPTTAFHIDGGNPIGFGDRLEIQTSSSATFFPGPENDEGAYVAPGLKPVSFDHIEEHAVVAGLTDLLVQLLPDQRVNVRISGGDIEVVDADSAAILALHPLDQFNSLKLVGTAGDEEVTVDFSTGFFALPSGIDFDGGAGDHDRLAVIGTGDTQADYSMIVNPVGSTQLQLSDNGHLSRLRYREAEDLNFVGLTTFAAHSLLSVGSGSLSLGTSAPVRLAPFTTIAGGSLSSISTLVLGTGATLQGYGAINAPLAGEVGSLIRATGNLTIGQASSPIGFATLGELSIGGNSVELLDANQAVLGSLTSLGDAGAPGTVVSAGGLLIDYGHNVIGYGVLDTTHAPATLLMNNGAIDGNSAAEQITLTGYVKGVGTLDNVELTGTYSPGFSPAVLYHGSVNYGAVGTTIIELGGTVPGSSGFDQLNHSGVATLGGELVVQLTDDYSPHVGDSFLIITASEGVTGVFDKVSLPTAPLGSDWELVVEPHAVRIELVDLANIANVRFGDGSQQRSRIEKIEVTFEGQVDIDSEAFALIKRGADGGVVETSFTTRLEGSDTVATLRFSGLYARGLDNLLADGNYQFTVHGSGIRRAGTSLALDGDNDGLAGGERLIGASEADEFYAYYGDVRGTRAVGTFEFNEFRKTYRKQLGEFGYNPLFDVNGDSAIGLLEFNHFRRNFGKLLEWE